MLDQALGLDPPELSLLTVLMLRGPQTPGELRSRTERMYRFESNEDLDRSLRALIERELVAPLPRRPGERGQRYAHLLQGEAGAGESAAEAVPGAPETSAPRAAPVSSEDGGLAERVERLEAEMSALRAELRSLREELGA